MWIREGDCMKLLSNAIAEINGGSKLHYPEASLAPKGNDGINGGCPPRGNVARQ
jgi:hypothetical protein